MRVSLTQLTVWAVFFCLGSIVSFYSSPSFSVLLFLALLVLTATVFIPFVLKTKEVVRVVLILGVLLSAFVCGAVRMSIAENAISADSIITNEEVTVSARIVSEADITEERSRYIVGVLNEEDEVVIRARMSISRFPEYFYGDIVTIKGEFSLPEAFETEDGSFFDYPAYLKAKKVQYILEPSDITATGEYKKSFRRTLLVFKYSFLSVLREVLPEPHASLSAGILLGVESSLGDRLLELFRITGLIHIIVLSGYNVTIVAEWIMRIVGKVLPFRASIIAGSCAIVAFAVLTGLTATVVRASVMALLALFARATGNTYMIGRALVLAGLCMILANPYLLIADPSFQLSFIASFGLIYGAPLVVRYFTWVRASVVREIIGATIATQIAVLPIILSFSGELSLVSVPVNVLTLLVIPYAMFFSFSAGILGMVSGILAMPFSFVTYVLLEYVLRVVYAFGTLPFSVIPIGIPNNVLILVSYIALLALYYKIKKPA
ncbi:MAG: ComEC/Rec2 family competence protein [Candidatus Paceibacterota bacterium]